MISKMRPFRRLTVACAVLALSSTAFAKDKDKDKDKKKDAASEHKGGMMEEGGKDPAETETGDEDGQFVPGKKKKPVKHAEGEEGEATEEEESSPEARALAASEKKNPKQEEEAPKEKKPVRPPRKTLGIFAEGLIGFGEAPIPGPGNLYTGKSTSFGFLVGGHYDLTTELRLSLRLPWTTGTVPINNKDASANALGNPEMAARYRFTDPGDTEVAAKVAVGIPVAQGNPDLTDGKDTAGLAQEALQRVANAANGWHDPELYATKRLPVTPSVTISHHADAFRVGGEFKAIFLPKIGGTISQPGKAGPGTTYEMKSMALTLLLGGSASYEVLEKKFIALALWGTYRVADTVEYTSDATAPTRLQFVMEPKILAQFGHFLPSVGFLIPLGGQLGGHINGLRIHVDAVF